jgi:alpha-N-acetylglucosaminidase
MLQAAPDYVGNANYAFDLADIRRQANADEGNRLIRQMAYLHDRGITDSLTIVSDRFLNLILEQDSTLARQPDMCVDTWLDDAAGLAGDDDNIRKLYRRNAAQLITVWGDSVASNLRGLHDYSHREWSGLLRELYYQRWKAFFDSELRGALKPDYYLMETEWVRRREQNQ